MRCPQCDHTQSKVIKTVVRGITEVHCRHGEVKKRVRRCKHCFAQFASYEFVEGVAPVAGLRRRPLRLANGGVCD